jgi:hypothetical protein
MTLASGDFWRVFEERRPYERRSNEFFGSGFALQGKTSGSPSSLTLACSTLAEVGASCAAPAEALLQGEAPRATPVAG